MSSKSKRVNIAQAVGRGYKAYWQWRGRYRVVKGSRASKKSKTTALWYIYHLMKIPSANLLVVRKTYRTLKDSCWTELKRAANRLGVAHLWAFKESPLEAIYRPTGQRISFRGLDDPLKVTSITVEEGSLCWLWIEEAYEIGSREDFEILDESIRGETPPGAFKQITLTFNPWNERHWIKSRFFDDPDAETLAITTDYRLNEFLDDADRRVFEAMRTNNPRRYQVAGLGNWGIVDGLVYDNWSERAFDLADALKEPSAATIFGLDFGYTNDPTALFCGVIVPEAKRLYVFDELYEKALTNEAIAERITELGYSKERITADSAEPKSIDRLRELGLRRVSAARKGRDSIKSGIDFIQDYEIIIHPQCVNFLTEIGNYQWAADRFGQLTNRPAEGYDHLMDAMRYATEGHQRGPVFSFE